MAKIISERPWLWATHVWNMFDFGCDNRNEGGAPGRNNKGLVTMDRKTRKDAYYIYKAYWSKEPFVYVAGRRYAQRPGEKMQVRVYSNQKEVTLYVGGQKFASAKGDKVFLFFDVPLEQEWTAVTARAGGCAPDTVCFQKVERMPERYCLPDDDDYEGDGVKNWFDDIVADEIPELTYREGFFSLRDTVCEIMANQTAAKIFRDAINRATGMTLGRNTFELMGKMRVEELAGLMSGMGADDLMALLNAELQKIPKER